MSFQELLNKLQAKGLVTESKEDLSVLNAWVEPSKIKEAVSYAKDAMGFTQLSFVTAVDRMAENNMEVIYRLFNYDTAEDIVLRVKLERAAPKIETVSGIFRTADWHERETAEMFGITFLNHPDHNRLLLPDGVDAPLRKDFKHEDYEPLPKS